MFKVADVLAALLLKLKVNHKIPAILVIKINEMTF